MNRLLLLSVLLGSTVLPLVADPCPILLESTRSFPTESNPRNVAVADLNEDGIPDLLTACRGGRYLTVLLADLAEPGVFDSTRYRVWGGPEDLVVADLNGDDIFDVAVACESTGSVSILLGNGSGGVGDGTFPPRKDVLVGGGASGITAGDLDGDEIPDLAVACSSIDSVAVLIGNGDGTFQAAVRFPAGQGPRDIAAAHVNGDTLLDLIVSCAGHDSVAVLDGVPGAAGTFAAPRPFAAGTSPMGIAAEDISGDGIVDIIAANSSSPGPALSVLIGGGAGGVGDGTFAPPVGYFGSSGALGVALGDLTGDGKSDILAPSALDSSVALLPGNGDGTFQAPDTLLAGGESPGAAVADVNGDGLSDGIVAAPYRNRVTILSASPTGDGTLIERSLYEGTRFTMGLVAADFDEDGILDLASADERVSELTVLIGGGMDSVWDGTFAPAVSVPAGDHPTSIACADFDEDDILDLVITNRFDNTVGVHFGNGSGGVGDGTFQPHVPYAAGNEPRHVAVTDLNADDIYDLLVASYFSDDVAIYLGNGAGGVGDGTFNALGTVAPGNGCQYVDVADFNEDGILDMAVANSAGNDIAVLLGGGSEGVWDSTFGAPTPYPVGTFPSAVRSEDLSGDGILDLIAADHLSDQISVLLGGGAGGVGDGTFQPATAYPTGAGCRRIELADFNDDGFIDAATSNRFSFDVSILAGRGDGTFDPAVHYDVGDQPWPIVSADFNGDGAPDLAVGNWFGFDVSLLLNLSCVYVGVPAGAPPAPSLRAFHAPNPFNPEATITFDMPERGSAGVRIYDVRGRLVRTLAEGHLESGRHRVVWDGRDRSGGPAPSGVYFYRIAAGGKAARGKMILIR